MLNSPVGAAGEVNDTRGRPNPLPRSDNHTSNHSDTLFRLEGLKVKDVWDESVATCLCVCVCVLLNANANSTIRRLARPTFVTANGDPCNNEQ